MLKLLVYKFVVHALAYIGWSSSMEEMSKEPDPDLESKIWRLTGFRAGSGFGVNFSDSARL